MDVTNVKIAIVGSGMAGLASAVLLNRLGAKVCLYDQFDAPQALGAGLLLQPAGMWVLHQLGLLDAVRQTSSQIERLRGCAGDGQTILDLHYNDYSTGAYALGVHRGQLFNRLLELAKSQNVSLKTNAAIETLKSESYGYSLVLKGGERQAADLIIIANGAFSNLRRCLDIPIKESIYPWGALWHIFDDQDRMFNNCLEQVYSRAHIMIGMLPSGMNPTTQNNCVSFFWSLPGDMYDHWRQRPIGEWKSVVLRYWPDIKPFIDSIQSHDDLVFARYTDVRCQRLYDRNAVLLGDAAHAMSPQLGQGVNLALLDAWRLYEVIQRASSLEQALVEFDRCRKSQLSFYQTVSSAITPFYQSNSGFLGWVRDAITPFSCWFPPFKAINLNILMGNARGLFKRREIEKDTLMEILHGGK